MIKDFGWQMRSELLRRDAESKLVVPLRRHGWQANVERVEGDGEYAVISAERNGVRRTAALLYSSATANGVYRRLEGEVDVTLFNGQAYQLEQFTHGLKRPVFPADGFQHQLVEWNRDSEPDRLAKNVDDASPTAPPDARLPRVRRLLSEVPIDVVWSRLARLKSATLARKAVAARAAVDGVELPDDGAASKGDGVAYAIRNATDYFSPRDVGNLSQRILNLYYGCLSFVLAEMLAAPLGRLQLEQVEDVTKLGHGLWNLDQDAGFGTFAIGPLQSGLFPAWMKAIGPKQLLAAQGKPKTAADLAAAPAGSWATMEQLFARIPEVGDLFEDVFPGAPAWVTPAYDREANMPMSLAGGGRPKTTYVLLLDDTGRMTAQDVGLLPGPLREIKAVPSGTRARHFRAAVDHPDADYWWGALNIHHSPFERNALILPLFGGVDQYRAISVVILYGLSIIVRYRPSLWRRIQEGDLDHMRALIEAFLATVERILPEQFLESITGERLSIHQPGSFFS